VIFPGAEGAVNNRASHGFVAPPRFILPHRIEMGRNVMRLLLTTCVLIGALGFWTTAQAEQIQVKSMKIWNLTAATITDLRLAPAGKATFGRNLVLDDKDGEINIDERLTLKDVAPGDYDVTVALSNKRHCKVQGLKLEDGQIVSIEEKDLRDCSR